MEHAEARQLASLAVDTPLTSEWERDLALHLVGCAGCKTFYEHLGRARAAFRHAAVGAPAAGTVEHAVLRTVTVQRGDADPGPAPAHDVGESTGEMPAAAVTVEAPPSPERGLEHIRLIPQAGTPRERPEGPPMPPEAEPPAQADPGGEAWAPPPAAPAPVTIRPGDVTTPPAPEGITPFDDLEPARVPRRERRAQRREARGKGPRRALGVLAGIVAALGLAAAAVFVIAKGPGVRERLRPRMVPAAELRQQVNAALDDLRAIETSYSVTRLGLYAEGQQRILFSNATERGRVVAELPDKLREERTLDVPGGRSRKVTVVRTAQEVRTLTEDAGGRTATVETNVALGPPEAPLLGAVGVLERGIGAVSRMLVRSGDLRVIEKTTFEERPVWHVRFSVPPNTYTRADRIDAWVDARNWIVMRAQRSLPKSRANLLGPPDLVTPEVVAAAFGARDRTVTESVELANVRLNDVVLPGEFVLTFPQGTEARTADGGWEQVSRATIEDKLPFRALLPGDLPPGFRERGFAVRPGRMGAWGARGIYALADGGLQAAYSDGKTTIVVAEARLTRRRELAGPPVAAQGLEPQTENVVRSGRAMRYVVPAEGPPYVYAIVGDVLIVVSGYASQDDLVRLAAWMGRTLESPSPGAAEASAAPEVSASPDGGTAEPGPTP